MSANVLLLEGPKWSGKTTTAKMLERRGFCYFKDNTFYAIKDNNDVDFQKHILERNLIILEKFVDELPGVTNLIIDRHHLTDYVYSTLYKRTDSDDAINKFKERDYSMASKNSVLIMLTDEPSGICKRSKREIELVNNEVHAFDKAFFESSMKKYKLNLNDTNFKTNLNIILAEHFKIIGGI